MSGVVLDDNPQTPYALQRLCRLKMITRLEADILADMEVCELEGWDKMEYVNELYELLKHFKRED